MFLTNGKKANEQEKRRNEEAGGGQPKKKGVRSRKETFLNKEFPRNPRKKQGGARKQHPKKLTKISSKSGIQEEGDQLRARLQKGKQD